MSTAAAPVLTQAEFEAANASAIAWLTSLGAHLMPLREMEKRPVSAGWPVNPAVTPESAEGWVAQFGNLGVNVGRLGFLAELTPDELLGRLDVLAQHRYTVENLLTLSCTLVPKKGPTQSFRG